MDTDFTIIYCFGFRPENPSCDLTRIGFWGKRGLTPTMMGCWGFFGRRWTRANFYSSRNSFSTKFFNISHTLTAFIAYSNEFSDCGQRRPEMKTNRGQAHGFAGVSLIISLDANLPIPFSEIVFNCRRPILSDRCGLIFWDYTQRGATMVSKLFRLFHMYLQTAQAFFAP